ncbi:MAG TPA: DUF86 domain-containing protein [Sphingobacteriaceae bacterium]
MSDILNSISHVEEFTRDVKSFDDFTSNFLIKSAVERHFTIIGEAALKYSRSGSIPLSSTKEIVSLRNHLVHGYDNIDDRILWSIICLHLKPFKQEVVNLLKA